MRVTNRFKLPQPFVDAVSYDSYDKGNADYSTTGLLKPARISELMRRNGDRLEEDAADLVFRMSGQVRHVVLERIAKMNPERYMVEKRFFMDIDGVKVGGQIDLYDIEDQWLYDWKETSIWKIQLGDQDDWTQQAAINTLLLRRNGIEIKGITNIAFLKDWKKREADRKQDYPQSAVRACPLPMWPEEKALAFVRERIAAHEAAKVSLPLCSDEERWARPERWALMQKGKKRALKLYETEAQAQAALEDQQERQKHRIEHRPGEQIRCLFYCPVSQYCQQFRELMQEKT